MIAFRDMAARFRLKKILEDRQPPISQSELARQSKVSIVTINAMVNNRTTRVDLATLDSIATTLGIAPGDLIEHVARRKGAA